MRLSSLIPLLIVLWPIAEIATFVWVGGHIGVFNTIALVILSGFAGLGLIRVAGFGLARQLQAELSAGRMPAGRMLDMMVLVAAGLLLILPGFLSDALAFLLLFAPARRLMTSLVAARVTVRTAGAARWTTREEETVIDLDASQYRRREGDDGGRRPELPAGRDDEDGRP